MKNSTIGQRFPSYEYLEFESAGELAPDGGGPASFGVCQGRSLFEDGTYLRFQRRTRKVMRNSSKTGFHELLEYTYNLDVEPEEWQNRLTHEIHRRVPDAPGVLAYEFDIREPGEPVELGRIVEVGDIGSFAEQTETVHDSLKSDPYRKLAEGLGTHAATIREALRMVGVGKSAFAPVGNALERAGYSDFWGICCMNHDALGIVFAVPLVGEEAAARLDRRAWTRMGVHIAAAHRLQRRLKRFPGFEDADGIFRRDGKEVHLEGAAVKKREALRRFIRAVDKARADDYRRGEESTIDVWEGLLRGRWSLVDRVDSDGSRFLLLIQNDPSVEAPRVLTLREAQVASSAAQGHMNKEIAYELGLAVSTVASHLSKALAKLGLESRTELVWLYGRLGSRKNSNDAE